MAAYKIVLDAMGGDHAPLCNVEGAILALNLDPDLQLILTGKEPEIKALVKWFDSIQKQGKVAGIISYHSTGSILYGRCARQASHRVKKETTKMYKLARKLTGYRLVGTESISSARGCSREYFLYKRINLSQSIINAYSSYVFRLII